MRSDDPRDGIVLPDPRQLRADRSHRHDGLGGVAALVALVAARARQRLLHVRHRQHPERARHAGLQLDRLDPARRLGADVVVVVGLAADDRPQARDARVAARLGEVLGGKRQLEGAGHVERVDVLDARLGERGARPALQAGGEILVEAPDGDRVAGRQLACRSSRSMSSSTLSPWWWSMWPIRSALARRYASLCALGTCSIGIWALTDRP